jgi:hypothetical protein
VGRRSRRREGGRSPAGQGSRSSPRARRDQGSDGPTSTSEGATATRAPETPEPAPHASRAEAKNAAARAKLTPLAEGERPRAVTVGALVAVAFAIGNLVAWFAGLEVRDERQPFLPVAVLAALLLVTAWGMWRARYWAVLGMQALLGITLLIFGLLILLQATLLQALIYIAVVILPGGALFWFLVKAMARIQMPERPQRR